MTDLSSLSDADLVALYQQAVTSQSPAPQASGQTSEIATPPGPLKLRVQPQGTKPVSDMTDEELLAAYNAHQQAPSGQRLALDFMNQGSAASQGTTPSIEAHQKNLISADTYQNDAGQVLFRDPETGQLIPTDRNKHVALRDPEDQKVKVFARTGGFSGTDENRLGSAARLFMTGAANNAPTRLASIKAPVPSVDELKAAAKAGFQSPAVSELQLQTPALKRMSEELQATLNAAGLDENVAPKTFGILGKVTNVPEGAVSVSGQNLQSLRRTLGHAAQSIDPSERYAATRAIEHLDNFVEGAPKADVLAGDPQAASAAWQDARGNYAAAMRGGAFDKRMADAELRASTNNSGMNVANKLRQNAASVVISDKAHRGYSPQEIAGVRQLAEGTGTQNALRRAGNFLGGGGGLGALASTAAGAGAGAAAFGPFGAAFGAVAPVLGYVFKAVNNRMTIKQAEKLSEHFRSRSPLGKAMEASALRLDGNYQKFAQRPSYENYATLNLAARNLANTMAAAGVKIHPSELLRVIRGPANAEPDQQQ